ncbi:bifunctional DNA primase/polymerase [Lentzea flaviverrucosa]|uniref:bifunctional DNA primase/polymerase n=1 Tax=Lentzea flaviverrucosa TaxID=200379 RepID=UPI001FEAEB41|nr:bifunctional DNA primase/polymerase [Lentzea flaviverrucosa]
MNSAPRLPRRDAAFAAAARGWPVVPAHPFSQVPIFKHWDSVATTDPTQIAAWWAQAPYNVAIACRPAGLVVIDLDPAHGELAPEQWARRGARHGRDVLRLLAHDLGESDPLDTYRVCTPSGGEHRYFRAPRDVALRNTVGTLGWHIDTRAQYGCIIAAGSIRRIHGALRLYRPVHPLRPVAPLPLWLVAALTPPPAPPPRPLVASGIVVPSRRATAYAAAAVQGETAKVRDARVGTRAHTLFVAAIKLGQIIGCGWLDERDVVDALLTAAARHEGVGRWTRGESLHHIENGITRGIREPRVITDAA